MKDCCIKNTSEHEKPLTQKLCVRVQHLLERKVHESHFSVGWE